MNRKLGKAGEGNVPPLLLHIKKIKIMKEENAGDIIDFIQLHFKLFNGVNVFIVELFSLYPTPTTGSTLW